MSPLKLIRRHTQDGNYVTTWQPDPVPWEFTDSDVIREATVLDDLAAETARTNCSVTAATNLFGGDR